MWATLGPAALACLPIQDGTDRNESTEEGSWIRHRSDAMRLPTSAITRKPQRGQADSSDRAGVNMRVDWEGHAHPDTAADSL